ncbi:Uncharacterised protein [uncultured archaeon]|nr:Uncharacterised protein [uncultured archaeon]
MMFGIGILGLLFGLVVLVISILVFVFWILMLVDVIKRKFKDDVEKIVWVLVIIFTYLIGALIYYFIVKRNKK